MLEGKYIVLAMKFFAPLCFNGVKNNTRIKWTELTAGVRGFVLSVPFRHAHVCTGDRGNQSPNVILRVSEAYLCHFWSPNWGFQQSKLPKFTCTESLQTYRDVVTVGPIAVTSIRKLSAVCDFSLGFDIFISSVTHGPSSIV